MHPPEQSSIPNDNINPKPSRRNFLPTIITIGMLGKNIFRIYKGLEQSSAYIPNLEISPNEKPEVYQQLLNYKKQIEELEKEKIAIKNIFAREFPKSEDVNAEPFKAFNLERLKDLILRIEILKQKTLALMKTLNSKGLNYFKKFHELYPSNSNIPIPKKPNIPPEFDTNTIWVYQATKFLQPNIEYYNKLLDFLETIFEKKRMTA